MSILKKNLNLSKKNIMVYEVFKHNPFTAFDVNELLEIVNKDRQIMSRRTIFRAIKNLMNIDEIYCCNMCRGIRKFQLLNNNYYVLICEKCGSKIFKEINESNDIREKLNSKDNFVLKKMAIEFTGICEKCRNKNHELY